MSGTGGDGGGAEGDGAGRDGDGGSSVEASGAGAADDGPADATDPPGERPSARELVRRRRRDYRAPETGRHHHIGAAPERQPLLGEQGPEYVETAAVQLAARTVAQLEQQRDRGRAQMAQAAEALDFETAARLRDAVGAVESELDRRRV